MAETPASDQSRREAEIVDRHLPDGYTADGVSYPGDGAQSPVSEVEDPNQQSSLLLQGGDVHRDIFKIKARAIRPQRSNTFSAAQSPSLRPADANTGYQTVNEQRMPGGFRRQYVQRHGVHRRSSHSRKPVTKNFISFLEIYGSFAGEDLEDTDSDEESAVEDDEETGPSERRPLLGKRKSTTRRIKAGDAGMTKSFFTLLKAFIGTGIMFLPKAFRNGGILFSSITLITVSILTTVCFRLLLKCRFKYGGGGYGELGEAVFGPKFRKVILTSITLSQLGFVCAGLIFTAENWLSVLNATVKPVNQPFGTNALIAFQFVLLIPLALIRNISKLGPSALLADVFIGVGLVYIWYYDFATLAQRGLAPSVVKFNSSYFTLTIGSAIFTFEGIGLILPIQSSMKQPEKFPYLLYSVMLIITVIFTSVGALCYATFGDETKIQIISNFPQTSKVVNAVQSLYAIAVLVGTPVQLFPATRIIEQSLFGDKASGRKSATIKWKKNALRTGLTILCGLVAIIGASDLDKFVSLIGAFACVPLVYIYPPYLHWKGVAEKWHEKAFDMLLMSIGVVAMVYSTGVTVTQWVKP